MYIMSKNITSKRSPFLAVVALALLFLLTALLFYTGVLQINNPSKKKYPVRGVDVSAYQGDIDWQILSNQEIDFAYIKATEGSSFVDGKFSYNWSEASKTKLRVGAYHFFSLESLGETQVENFIEAVSEIENMLPPVVDVEPYGNFNSIEQRNIDELKVWLNLVEEHYGVRPIIYTTEKYYSFLRDNLDGYEFWLRSVYSVPRKDKDWCIWQYSNRKRLKGYNGKEKYIDMNVFYGTKEEFALFGKIVSDVMIEENEKNQDDKLASFKESILEKEKSESAYDDIEPSLYDQYEVESEKGKLYFFSVRSTPIGEGDNSYIVKESDEGIEIVFEYWNSARNRHNIYDGVYVQNCANGGAAYNSETMHWITDEVKTIYSYETGFFSEYFFDDYPASLQSESNALELLYEAGFTDDMLKRWGIEKFTAEDSTVWLLMFPKEMEQGEIECAYQIIDEWIASDTTTVCRDREEFISKSKALLESQGVDIDELLSGNPLIGEKESFIWYRE